MPFFACSSSFSFSDFYLSDRTPAKYLLSDPDYYKKEKSLDTEGESKKCSEHPARAFPALPDCPPSKSPSKPPPPLKNPQNPYQNLPTTEKTLKIPIKTTPTPENKNFPPSKS